MKGGNEKWETGKVAVASPFNGDALYERMHFFNTEH